MAVLQAVAKHDRSAVPQVVLGTDIAVAVAERERRVLGGDLGQLASAVGSLEGQRQEKLAVKTGTRRIISYLVSPILQVATSALHER